MAKQKPYWEMNTADLREATKEFDQEFIIDTFKPLTAAQRRQWERAKRKRGRPRVGSGSKAISVTIEKSLLREVDQLAKRAKTTRAKLIAQGLQDILTRQRRAAG